MNSEDGTLTKNDIAWNKIFNELNISQVVSEQGLAVITARQIKDISGREPRLMAKFDHSENLPKVFRDNELAILPISRGSYVISNFNVYHQFEVDDAPIERLSLPSHLQSLNADNIFSETVALNSAFASGMLKDFLNEDELFSTVSGRMKSGDLEFSVYNTRTDALQRVAVNNAQIEIDAAYEGVESLAIFEAKNDLSPDFLVRQLYYPFLTWSSRITKPIRSVFLVYSNGIYRLYEYGFECSDNYNSIKLVKHKRYSVEDTGISMADIQDIFKNIQLVNEPTDIPFPQADDFERVINLCELLNEQQQLTRNEVTDNYAFNARQTNYYVDAARYLGLVEKNRSDGEVTYKLSLYGLRVLRMPYKQRQLELCKDILQHRAFYLTFQQSQQIGAVPHKQKLMENLDASTSDEMSETTLGRRSSTIRGWIEWIFKLINEE